MGVEKSYRFGAVRGLGIGLVLVLIEGSIALCAVGNGTLARVSQVINRASTSSAPISNSQCIGCHRMEPVLSHPVDVIPSMALPRDLPLDNGRVTCETCHRSDVAGHTAKQPGDAMLRSSAATCNACHVAESFSKSAHATAISRAHLRGATVAQESGLLDADSRMCVTCHDGTVAGDVGIGGVVNMNMGGATGFHPVGVQMQRHGLSDARAARVKGLGAMDQRIRLFEGRVGCGSCHSPYSGNGKLLVISNERSRLCLTCHRD